MMLLQRWDDVAADETVDPFALVGDEVNGVSHRLCQSVVTNIPTLESAAEYFFRPGVRGKRLRPTLLLLWASALSDGQPAAELLLPDLTPPHQRPVEQRRRQQRIAEIAELIHVASLLHDDVLDDAETRRGILSLNAQAGNKLAILAGDFLLARASVTLASLQNTGVCTHTDPGVACLAAAAACSSACAVHPCGAATAQGRCECSLAGTARLHAAAWATVDFFASRTSTVYCICLLVTMLCCVPRGTVCCCSCCCRPASLKTQRLLSCCLVCWSTW